MPYFSVKEKVIQLAILAGIYIQLFIYLHTEGIEMENSIKISASAILYNNTENVGTTGNFYMNGTGKQEYDHGNVRVSQECASDEYIFGITDGMDREIADKKTSISMVKELKKYHSTVKGKGGDLESKLEQLKDTVAEINSIIYSLSLNNSSKENKPAFGGLFISGSKAAAINCGKARVYYLRNGNLRLMTGELEKKDKLLKMGGYNR